VDVEVEVPPVASAAADGMADAGEEADCDEVTGVEPTADEGTGVAAVLAAWAPAVETR
jgi:hypothetical protein